MWDSSQAGVYFQRFRKGRRLRPSIPLIIPGSGFMALMNSFTESWGGILRALIGGPGRSWWTGAVQPERAVQGGCGGDRGHDRD
jgi:hypothetical protein